MKTKYTICAGMVALSASIVTSGVALAADPVRVTQQGKQFSEKNVNLSAGQEIIFVNNDTVAHNVYTIVQGKKRDLGLQKSGEEDSITFDAAGTYRVRCAIHPKMKMVVKVD